MAEVGGLGSWVRWAAPELWAPELPFTPPPGQRGQLLPEASEEPIPTPQPGGSESPSWGLPAVEPPGQAVPTGLSLPARLSLRACPLWDLLNLVAPAQSFSGPGGSRQWWAHRTAPRTPVLLRAWWTRATLGWGR